MRLDTAFFINLLLIISLTAVGFIAKCASAEEVHPGCTEAADKQTSERSFRYEQYFLRAHPEIDRVVSILWDEGLPAKWLYLMLIESGGRQDAASSEGASGLWQLTAATAKAYGCTDRADTEQATRAAARYISKLLKDFDGDEWKAIAAYNMGGRNLKKNGPTPEAKALADQVFCLFHKDPFFLDSME